jgi:radical SAM protein with 4Fe4S-binding SPASM domain
MVEAHYAAQKGVENAADFLGGCGAGRLYCCLEPNGDMKPCVFFPTNKNTVLGNILRDDFEEIWDKSPLLWQLRIRENLQDYVVNGKEMGCGTCPDQYICGGCRARAYSYFNGNVKKPDMDCIPTTSRYGKKYLETNVSECYLRFYAFPFSSLPKYIVHLSLRASLPNCKELFLHLPEQNHKTAPSFLTYIIPVPAGNSPPQNEHFLGLGIESSSMTA